MASRIARGPVSIREGVAVPFKSGDWGMLPDVHVILRHGKWRCTEGKKQTKKKLTKCSQQLNTHLQTGCLYKPLSSVLLVWTELTQLHLGASRCRLLFPAWVAFMFLSASLSFLDRYAGAVLAHSKGRIICAQRLTVLGYWPQTSEISALWQSIFTGDGWSHEMSRDNLLCWNENKEELVLSYSHNKNASMLILAHVNKLT